VSPAQVTFSKGNPADALLAVTGNVSITALRNGGATVNAANYSVAAGVLTISGQYLATLVNGVKTFTLIMSYGDNLTVTVTVDD